MSELTKQAEIEFAKFIERVQEKLAKTIRDEADAITSRVYTDYGMHLETDSWTNYRESLKRELAGGLYKSVTDGDDALWAKNIRQMIFTEYKDALVVALDADLKSENERLKQEIKQAYERRIY